MVILLYISRTFDYYNKHFLWDWGPPQKFRKLYQFRETINHITLFQCVFPRFALSPLGVENSVLRFTISKSDQSNRSTTGHSGGLKIMHKSQTGSGHWLRQTALLGLVPRGDSNTAGYIIQFSWNATKVAIKLGWPRH